jgi:ribonuclease HII
MLQSCYDPQNDYEIGVDEAGRGPLYGRLYVAAVVLPKDSSPCGFRHEDMKDSKKFHSKKKIQAVAEYIKQNAVAWSVQFVEPNVIDEINIRQSVFQGMHAAIADIIAQIKAKDTLPSSGSKTPFLMIDGNDFKPYTIFDPLSEELHCIPHETIEGGDNKYTAIAAASILAKVTRDQYIQDECLAHPELVSRYALDKNQGYGTKRHLEGILEHGITQWHRKTYGRCSTAKLSAI